MYWDRKRDKWSSLTQQRKDERKDAMALFRKKVEEVVSAFDNLPPEVQAKLAEDVLSIVRTLKSWPLVVPQNFHGPIGAEIVTLLRKSGLKLAGVFLGGSDLEKGIDDIMKEMKLPGYILQVIEAVKMVMGEPVSAAPPVQVPSNEDGGNGSAA